MRQTDIENEVENYAKRLVSRHKITIEDALKISSEMKLTTELSMIKELVEKIEKKLK